MAKTLDRGLENREIVLDILTEVLEQGAFVHLVLNQALQKYQYLGKADRSFITRAVEGTLEYLIQIDEVINRYSKTKIYKMKPFIRSLLRMSVYQILYMDRVPDSAVCNEAVKLAVRKGFSNLKGFVNGVLRTISRNLESVELTSLSVKYSLPQWIVDQWLESYDEDTVARMGQAFLEEHPTTIRCNLNAVSIEALTKELREEQVEVEETSLPYALHIHGYDYLNKLTSFQKGHFYVQDISSMQVAEWADPKEGDYVIDVCAAPGGKAIHMAEKLAGSGHVEARDLTEYKVGLINENIQRSRLDNIEAVCHDATVYDEAAKDKADIVIADLPCSGLGVLGKKVDLKYKMTEDMQRDLAGLQRKILSVVHTYVKPGGKLVYSTCTIHRGENEDNARWFEETYPQFRLVKEQQFLPGREEGDGFYIALFERERHG